MVSVFRKNLGRTLAVAVGIALLAGLFPAPAAASRLDELRGKVNKYLAGRRAAQKDLRGVKTEQQEAQGQLTAAQYALEQAQVKVRRAQAELAATKKQVAETERKLDATKARLAQHQEEMQQRLLAAYRSGEPTYLEVVFQATSFADFVNRAEFTRRLARRDEDLLTNLVAEKQTFERQKAQLAAQRAQQAVLETELRGQRDIVALRQAQAEQVLRDIKQDRARAEQQFALMEQEYDRIAAELAAIQRRAEGYRGTYSGSLMRPISGGVITSRFGWRIHPILKKRKKHCGIDIAGLSAGTPIKAADDGLVIFAGWSETAGKMVRIDHGSGIVTLYAHLSRYAVRKGQAVKRGQVIGYLGGTGVWSTGPHLHFGVCQNGRWVNPELFVRF